MGDKKNNRIEEINKDLENYRMVDTESGLQRLGLRSRIKYLDKTKDKYHKGGWLFKNDYKNDKYIIESLIKPKGRPIRWSVTLSNIIVFTRDKRKKYKKSENKKSENKNKK